MQLAILVEECSCCGYRVDWGGVLFFGNMCGGCYWFNQECRIYINDPFKEDEPDQMPIPYSVSF